MAVRRRFLLVVAVLTAGAAILAQAPAQLQVDGAEAGFHVAGDQTFTGRGHSVRTPLPPGEYVLHFAPAHGRKAASLPLLLREGADVHVAVGRAADADPAAGKPLFADAFASSLLPPWTGVDGAATTAWQRGDGVLKVRPSPGGASPTLLVVGPEEPRDYLLRARVRLSGQRGSIGLLARCTARDQNYRLVWDGAKDQLRLERQLGPQLLVLAEAPAPARDGKAHELALQVQGFRLQAFCDDAVVAQTMDG
ncbi:MAG TPA: hypothetical protein VK348_12750, partial [Planctomycetota bacterium]|nr:hypothetical protein [Planctomycetota bacterium]